MLSIEDGELLNRDLAGKPDRQSITAVVRKPVGMANCRSLFCRASEPQAYPYHASRRFLGSGYGWAEVLLEVTRGRTRGRLA